MLVSITAKENQNQMPKVVMINPDYISDATIAGNCTIIKMASGTEYVIETSEWLIPACEESPVICQIYENMEKINNTQSIDDWADEMYEKHGRSFYDYPDL